MTGLELKSTASGIILPVLVQPKSARNEILGPVQGRLKIRLTAPPVEGEANKALIAFLAKRLKVAKSRINILKGQKNRRKMLIIEGESVERIEAVIGVAAETPVS